MKDVIVDQIRLIREDLIKRHGGIDGYFKYCQAQERARSKRSQSRHPKKKFPSPPHRSKTR
jgi:hypothetical protein